MYSCNFQNTRQTNFQLRENSHNHKLTLNEMEWDSTVMENDSTIYDSRLQALPFTNATIECFEKHADSISHQKIQVYDRTYNLKKIYYHDSYMLFAENDEYGKSLIVAVISDTIISLANHIKVGMGKNQLEVYYNRNIKRDTIYLIDESEFTEIKIHIKHDVIYKIIFVCYECENELGLL